MIGNAREHIRRYIDALIAHSHDQELRLREFFKSLEGQAFTWYTSLLPGSFLSWNDIVIQFMKKFSTVDERLPDLQQERQRVSEGLLDYIHRLKDLSLIYYDPVEEERFLDICIVGMSFEYEPYLDNLQIPIFTRLVEDARRTSMSVKIPSKGLTSQTTVAPKQSWKKESKKIEAAMVEETKKVTKGKKRERSSIPPPFSISTKELYSILDAWVKDGVVVLPKCKREPIKEKK